MKIGILTFWWSEDNYGQLMQCYALQKYLRDAGHEAFLIRYRWEKDVKDSFTNRLLKATNPQKIINHIKYKLYKRTVNKEYSLNNRKFSDFRSKYINYTDKIYYSYDDLKRNPPKADIYIVGSDQVWRFGHRALKRDMKKLHAYFLDFGEATTKRLSYAASWGITELKDDFIKEISPLLQKFEYVSVRERSGLSICEKCGITQAEWVPDPTMLIDAEIYRNIYRESEIRKPLKPYLLLYMLNNDCDFEITKVYDFANSQDLDVVYVTGNGVIDKYDKYFATIPEWLYLIDNARYIITNSFHCCVFSTLFEKQYAAVPLTGIHVGMNSRLDSLFERFGIESRYLDNDFQILFNRYKKNDVSFNFIDKF